MNLLETAIEYAKNGWAVIPVHSVNIYGICSCGIKEDYSPAFTPRHAIGKHPYLGDLGHREASKDENQIRQWWDQWPNANIAIATGKISNIVVLDIDKKNGGLDSLTFLERKYGPIPFTPKVISGGGGVHFYFKHPGFEMRGRRGMLPGIDVQADGGRIVAPPSRHKNLSYYKWDLASKNSEPTMIPFWLKNMIMEKQSKRRVVTQQVISKAPPVQPKQKKQQISPIRYVNILDDY